MSTILSKSFAKRKAAQSGIASRDKQFYTRFNAPENFKFYQFQEEIVHAIFQDEKVQTLAVIAGRQLGKTEVACHVCVMMILALMGHVKIEGRKMQRLVKAAKGMTSDVSVGYFVPRQRQYRNVFETKINSVLGYWQDKFKGRQNKLYIRKHKTPDIQIEFRIGRKTGWLKFFGIDKDEEDKRGYTFGLAVLDEVASMKAPAVRDIIMPTVTAIGGPLLYTGTAKANAHLLSIMKMVDAQEYGKVMTYTIDQAVEDGQKDAKWAQLEAAKYPLGRDDPGFKQEYLCDWTVDPANTLLQGWKMQHYTGDYEGAEYYMSADIGFKDDYVIMVFAVLPDARVVLRYANHWNETYTREIIAQFTLDFPFPVNVYLPVDGNQRRAHAPQTEFEHWEELSNALTINTVPTMIGKTPINNEESIRLTRIRLNQILIDPSLDENDTVLKARNCQYAYNRTTGRFMDKHDKTSGYDHAFDAFRYGITVLHYNSCFQEDEVTELPIKTKYLQRLRNQE